MVCELNETDATMPETTLFYLEISEGSMQLL